MDFVNIFWIVSAILFFLSIALPAIRKKILERGRLAKLKELEKQRGSRAITLIHRQEILSFLGFPFFRYIDIEDSEKILRAIRMTDPEIPIDLIVHTPGGLVLAAEQIAHASDRTEESATEELADTLTAGKWTHDYPITVEEAEELGLPVNTEVPVAVYELMEMYPQTSQRRPSVQYIPMPRREDGDSEGSTKQKGRSG